MSAKHEIQEDLQWAVNMAGSVLALYLTWRMISKMGETKELQMRFWRGVARGARSVETFANTIANNANTEYLRLTP